VRSQVLVLLVVVALNARLTCTSASAVYMQHNNRRRILAGSKGTGKAQRLVVDWRGNGPPGAL
jgi:cell division protein FtsL